MPGIDPDSARQLAEMLDEILWAFEGHGTEGYCCDDVTYVEYRALRVLDRTDQCTMQSLARALGFSKSGATRVADRLERAGYVCRERSAEDHRVCCVVLTAQGKALASRIAAEFTAKAGASLGRLDEDMSRIFLASLHTYVRTLNDMGRLSDSCRRQSNGACRRKYP